MVIVSHDLETIAPLVDRLLTKATENRPGLLLLNPGSPTERRRNTCSNASPPVR